MLLLSSNLVLVVLRRTTHLLFPGHRYSTLCGLYSTMPILSFTDFLQKIFLEKIRKRRMKTTPVNTDFLTSDAMHKRGLYAVWRDRYLISIPPDCIIFKIVSLCNFYWLPVDFRIKFKIATFAFKVDTGTTPPYCILLICCHQMKPLAISTPLTAPTSNYLNSLSP